MTSRALLVLTTCANSAEAQLLASKLVEERLAACVSTMSHVLSTYRWEGKIERAEESLLVIKTTEERLAAVEAVIRAGSSYELPEVIAVPVAAGSPAYLEWLSASVADPKE